MWGKDEAREDPRETMRPLTSVATSGRSSLLPTQALQASAGLASLMPANTRCVATTAYKYGGVRGEGEEEEEEDGGKRGLGDLVRVASDRYVDPDVSLIFNLSR